MIVPFDTVRLPRQNYGRLALFGDQPRP
jgi:hypothetical protein